MCFITHYRALALVLLLGAVGRGCQSKGDLAGKKASYQVDKVMKQAIHSTPSIDQQEVAEGRGSLADGENTVDLGDRPLAPEPIRETMSPPTFPPPRADQMVTIPAGVLLVGSPVDDELRDQFAESDLVPVKMGAFEMDVLPWPNDPVMSPQTGISRVEAAALCQSRGKRLCTELEWERACKGDEQRPYISGRLYHEAAYQGAVGTPSPTGVYAMGTLLEITASPWGNKPDQMQRMAVRGFAPNQLFLNKVVTPAQGRRCAKRWRFGFEEVSDVMGFRCCRGPVNKAQVEMERPRPAHSLYKTIKPDEFAAIIKSIPELKAVHDNPHMFSNADIRAVLAKRGTDRKQLDKKGIHFVWKPLRWIPRQGMELWLAVGRSNKHSFVVALHEAEDNKRYIHESSLILWDNPMPLALVYREGHRDEVYWAPCWRCRDGGSFEYNPETNQVNITHRW